MHSRGLTVAEVAKSISASESTVYDLIYRRQLRAFKVNPGKGAVRIRPQDLDHFIQQRLTEVQQ